MIKSVSPLLQVRDLAASLAFYTGKLGFVELHRDPGGFAIIGRDGCQLFLAQAEKPVDLRNRTARLANSGFAAYDLHFYCEAGTLDTLWSACVGAGVPMPEAFETGPVQRSYGIRDFSILDPDGYDLVFGEPSCG